MGTNNPDSILPVEMSESHPVEMMMENNSDLHHDGPDTESQLQEGEKEGRWTKAFRFVLDPLGLWVFERKLNHRKGLVRGFPKIASLIASDPDHLATVYNRFDNLAARNLLLLEARVAALEDIQCELDREDLQKQARGDNFAVHTTPESFEYLAYLAYDGHSHGDIPEYALEVRGKRRKLDEVDWKNNCAEDSPQEIVGEGYFQKRWEVAMAIQKALKEYHEALLLQAKVLQLHSPTERTAKAVKRWIGEVDQKPRRYERPPQFRKTSAARMLLTDKSDLVSLHPPGDDDNGTRLVAKLLHWFLFRQKTKAKKHITNEDEDSSEKFTEASEKGIRRLTTIGTFFFAIGFLMGAVWLIRRVGLDESGSATKFERELVVMTVFTAVFGIWVAIFTSARRAEIFGATAAYAAVLIVFVGNNASTSAPG